MNYYNEIDPKKAAWLRELTNRNLISPGVVDERSIVDVRPADLRGFAQCHFFAGIGIWSYALRLAGWPDSRPVWTASCPCQPFSAAGKRKGTADERHLWPELLRLIRECRPIVALGEQVAGGDGLAWLDIVRTDLDECLYTCGHVVSPACGYGAPHRRERLYWVAMAHAAGDGWEPRRTAPGERSATAGCGSVRMADRRGEGLEEWSSIGGYKADGVGDSLRDGTAEGSKGCRENAGPEIHEGRRLHDQLGNGGYVRGAWAGAHWVLARPQRLGDLPSLRPVEPDSFPLAYGAPARVVRLRGYGDGIVAPQAAAFIEVIMEEMDEHGRTTENHHSATR